MLKLYLNTSLHILLTKYTIWIVSSVTIVKICCHYLISITVRATNQYVPVRKVKRNGHSSLDIVWQW